MPTIECIALSDMMPTKIPTESVICLGNFDGVHLAHRELLRLGCKMRRESFGNAACAVFCFREPSSDYLSPAKPAHLSTLAQKLQYFREEGVEYVFLADFPAVQELSAAEFAQMLLVKSCHCVAAVCGFNYRFGKGGLGSAKELSALLGCPVAVQSEVRAEDDTVSSTRIRRLLSEGNAEEAARLLTRPYCFSAKVVHGKALGQKLDAPTLNQYFPKNMLIPRCGVYVTACEVDGKLYRGVSNVGVRPTVDQNAEVNCETYLLDFSGNLYDKEIKLSFLKFLRPEQKFENAELLRRQIQADILAAKKY